MTTGLRPRSGFGGWCRTFGLLRLLPLFNHLDRSLRGFNVHQKLRRIGNRCMLAGSRIMSLCNVMTLLH